ncbi:hypothetical protein [Methylomicrobium sp. Wu6]|uniref:hypothetical protein n=1 Tax=Methylomicrobium sp. Wu6 TaxID=3107928 RepID=UPI002DD66F48|nr:hypothetical protein [Methylomicrobium sp. Wu6]MEC4750013.1 hypothetical protein [Methylomicrobium sp. Wu6]
MRNTYSSCIVTALFAVALFFICASARAEPRFNALDPGDPLYAEYQQGLCAETLAGYNRFSADKYWLDHRDPKFAGKSPEQREAWVVDYVITVELRDSLRERFNANCGGEP